MNTNPDPTERERLIDELQLVSNPDAVDKTPVRLWASIADFILADRQTQKQRLLARIESEVIGADSKPDDYDPDFLESDDIEDIALEGQNELRAEQRTALQNIERDGNE